MNQNTCKTCRWWRWDRTKIDLTFNPNDPPDSSWLDRTPTKAIATQHHCEGEHVNSRDPKGIIDAEEDTGILTGPDFGCIHYEETQEQLPQDHPGYAAQQARTPKGIKETEFMGFKIVCSCDSGPVSECLIHGREESVSDQIKRGVIPRRPDGSVCSP